MASNELPTPTLKISNQQARRFLLAHHGLWPPRRLKGKEGILDYITRVGCVQYDTINVVGRNADLVMQSRVKNYRPEMLDELLYVDRKLWDGFDKVASIFRIEDYPYFARRREYMKSYPDKRYQKALKIGPQLIQAIREQGPLSSLDFDHEERLDWFWGNPTKLSRAALEAMFETGVLGVHHKVGTRRVYDLSERLLGVKLGQAPDPNMKYEHYLDWHVLRRVGGLGLAHSGSGERWQGIFQAKSPQRHAALKRLVASGKLQQVEVEDIQGQTFYTRREDLALLDKISRGRQPQPRVSFIAPLDNLMWDRRAIEWLFGFEYVWEVYKPRGQRQFGYYTIPVLYGERFMARMDSRYDRKEKVLELNGWWWEKEVRAGDDVSAALKTCMLEFLDYLGASVIRLGDSAAQTKGLAWARDLANQ